MFKKGEGKSDHILLAIGFAFCERICSEYTLEKTFTEFSKTIAKKLTEGRFGNIGNAYTKYGGGANFIAAIEKFRNSGIGSLSAKLVEDGGVSKGIGDFILKCLSFNKDTSERWKNELSDFNDIDWKAMAKILSTTIFVFSDEESDDPEKYKNEDNIWSQPLAFIITKDYAGVLYDASITKIFIKGKD